jgi:hypothetical protein
MSQSVPIQIKTLDPPTIQPLAPGATSPGNSAMLHMNNTAATQTALIKNASGGKRMRRTKTKRTKRTKRTKTRRTKRTMRKGTKRGRYKYKHAMWGGDGGIVAHVAPCGLGASSCAVQQAASVANQTAFVNANAAATNDSQVQAFTPPTKGGRRR